MRLVVLDERLLEQADLGVELLELALDDLLDDRLGLALAVDLLGEDLPLALRPARRARPRGARDSGSAAAICIARSRTSVWKSSVRATKSVSQLTSISTPTWPPGWM